MFTLLRDPDTIIYTGSLIFFILGYRCTWPFSKGVLNCTVYGLTPGVRRAVAAACGCGSGNGSGNGREGAGGGRGNGGGGGGGEGEEEEEEEEAPAQLKDMSYQIRRAYIASLGLYQFMGVERSHGGGSTTSRRHSDLASTGLAAQVVSAFCNLFTVSLNLFTGVPKPET